MALIWRCKISLTVNLRYFVKYFLFPFLLQVVDLQSSLMLLKFVINLVPLLGFDCSCCWV